MRRLGIVEDISHRGMLIVRPGFSPRLGDMAVDRRKREVGRVVGLVGPSSRPFVLIEPLRFGGKGSEMVGMTVFLA